MQAHGGAIVNMLADIWTGYPGMAHMAAARAGIENLGITLSMEWAASDVRVNCVAPGTILSSGMLHYPREIQEQTAREAATRPRPGSAPKARCRRRSCSCSRRPPPTSRARR